MEHNQLGADEDDGVGDSGWTVSSLSFVSLVSLVSLSSKTTGLPSSSRNGLKSTT